MRTYRSPGNDAQRQHAEAIVSRHVRDLFKLLPRLVGFRLGADLTVVDVSASPSPAVSGPRGLLPLVMQSIVDFAECHPDAVELMRDRTFARAFH